jgi:MFS transporter, DHA2 family, multidrug resistance protein
VAVLGSLLSSGYRADMDAAVSGLPAGAADAARDSLGGALAVAAHGGGARLATTAQEAFVSGMHSAVIVAAGIALAGALIALVFLPARESEPAVERHHAAEALAA